MKRSKDLEEISPERIVGMKFKDAGDFLEWASNSPSCWKGELYSRKISQRQSEFTLTYSYGEAYKLAKWGWKEGRDLIDAYSHVEEITAQSLPEISYDVVGQVPDVVRAIGGDPFYMETSIMPDSSLKPIVRLAIHMSYNSKTTTNSILKWGGKLLGLIDKIELCGNRVEIEGVYSSESFDEEDGPAVVFRFILKDADQPLDVDRIAFWFAHPSALRRIIFSAMERLDVERYYGVSYGCSKLYDIFDEDVMILSIMDDLDEFEEGIYQIIKECSKQGPAFSAKPKTFTSMPSKIRQSDKQVRSIPLWRWILNKFRASLYGDGF